MHLGIAGVLFISGNPARIPRLPIWQGGEMVFLTIYRKKSYGASLPAGRYRKVLCSALSGCRD